MRPRRRHPVSGGETLLETPASLSVQGDRPRWRIALALGALLAAPAARGAPIPARELGQGSASVADPDGDLAIGASPAVLALRRRYALGASGTLGPRAARGFVLTAVDSTTSAVAVGLSFAAGRDEAPTDGSGLPGWRVAGEELPAEVNRASRLDAALAWAGERRRFALGAGGGWTRASSGGESTDAFEVSAGVGLRPWERLDLALAARDLLPESGVGARPATVAVGVGGAPVEGLHLLAEAVSALASPEPGWRAGVEGAPREGLVLRAGAAGGAAVPGAGADGLAVSAGITVEDQGTALDLGGRLAWGGAETWGREPAAWLGLGLRMGL